MAPIDEARTWLANARAVAALTGAGVSAESGIPTFRGAGGLWRSYRPETLATPEAFTRDPILVWEWYDCRRQAVAKAAPNPAHYALAKLEALKPGFALITQNVDGLHDLAGSGNVVKLHGDIWRLRCTACGAEWTDRRSPLPELPPRCKCGAMARPGVVWFGENLPSEPIREAGRAVRSADLLLVVGTSAVVYLAAGLIPLAIESGARVIEINIESTAWSDAAGCSLRGSAGEILPKLL